MLVSRYVRQTSVLTTSANTVFCVQGCLKEIFGLKAFFNQAFYCWSWYYYLVERKLCLRSNQTIWLDWNIDFELQRPFIVNSTFLSIVVWFFYTFWEKIFEEILHPRLRVFFWGKAGLLCFLESLLWKKILNFIWHLNLKKDHNSPTSNQADLLPAVMHSVHCQVFEFCCLE